MDKQDVLEMARSIVKELILAPKIIVVWSGDVEIDEQGI